MLWQAALYRRFLSVSVKRSRMHHQFFNGCNCIGLHLQYLSHLHTQLHSYCQWQFQLWSFHSKKQPSSKVLWQQHARRIVFSLVFLLILLDHFLHSTLCVTTAMFVSLYVLIVPTRGLITQSSGTRCEAIRTTATTPHRDTQSPLFKATHTSRTVRFKKPTLLADVQLDTRDWVYQVAFSKHKQLQLNIKSVCTRPFKVPL